MSNKLSKVVRLEIIDHTSCKQCGGTGVVSREKYTSPICDECDGMGSPGRKVVFWNAYKQIEASVQDDGKTLKIFISERD